jgi:DNA-3-methyladenine glycosylase II
VNRFGDPKVLPVRAPFRLDLTVDALRRVASNAVDVVAPDGTYYRALGSTSIVSAAQLGANEMEYRATARHSRALRLTLARLLGADVDLTEWYRRSRGIAWLRPLVDALRGLKPPRYPTLWEALAHAIIFQQISIHAAAAIMRRSVELLGARVSAPDITCIAFPPPEVWLEADDGALRAAGLSRNKVGHLRAAARALLEGAIDEVALEALSSSEAGERLRGIPGIGPWSASVVLLRGLGRLDVFPLRDSGVARSLEMLSGDVRLDQEAVLETLGPVRGMLYFHLLLGRLRNLAPA